MRFWAGALFTAQGEDLLDPLETSLAPVPSSMRNAPAFERGTEPTASATHFGALALQGDAVLTLTATLVGDKPQRPQVVVVNRRALARAAALHGRSRRRRWSRIVDTVQDSADVLGTLTMQADARCALNGEVIVPNEVTAELAMVGDAGLTLAGGIIQTGELVMVGDSVMVAAGVEIFGAELHLVGDAIVTLRGTGGASASSDPTQRRGGLVSIGVRGGHS